jgi:hypothetical protein
MDDDDPEKRIANLERQLGEARVAGDGANLGFQQGAFAPPPRAGFPAPPSPQAMAYPGPGSSPGYLEAAGVGPPPKFGPVRRLLRAVARVLAIGGLVVSVVLIGLGAYDSYPYFVGTPATATVGDCRDDNLTAAFLPAGWSSSCSATWSLGGQSSAGAVVGVLPPRHSEGSSIHVRVLGGQAYTLFSGLGNLAAGFFTAIAAIWLGFANGWTRRRIISVVLPSVLGLLVLLIAAAVMGGRQFIASRASPHVSQALNSPAPDWVGLLFLAVPAVLVLVYLWRWFGGHR